MSKEPSNSPSTATADPMGMLDAAGAEAIALVDKWVSEGDAPALAIVADQATGAVRKAARRGLNVLRSRGITVARAPRVAILGRAAEKTIEEALMLAPDAAGTSLFVFTSRTTSSRCRAAFVVLNDQIGVQNIENDELAQSKLQARLDHAITNSAYRPVRVPLDWARWRVARALARHDERRLVPPMGLATARELLEPGPSAPPSHPLEAEGLVLSEDDAQELAGESGRLHQLPEFQGWVAPKHAVDEMLLKVGETLKQGEEPPPGHVERRLSEEVRAATDRYFTPERRARTVELMRDSAISVLERAGEHKALEVVATMKAIERCGLITDPPHEVPFLRGFFDKAVGWLISQGGGSLRIPIPNRLPMDGGADGESSDAASESSDAASDATDAAPVPIADSEAPPDEEATAGSVVAPEPTDT